MRENIFMDTSALIALLNSRDQNHQKITSFLQDRKQSLNSVTTNLVLSELISFFSRHGSLKSVLEFQKKMLGDSQFKIIWADKALHQSASQMIEKYSDQQISFTDALSFAVMKKERISQALVFDDDFIKAHIHEGSAPPDFLNTSAGVAKSRHFLGR